MPGNVWIQYGALGILAVVVCVIMPKFFNKIIKVVENNTGAFTEVKGSLDNLGKSIDFMNGNQREFADTVKKTVTDQATIGKLQCDALTKMTKKIGSIGKVVRSCPVRKKKAAKRRK